MLPMDELSGRLERTLASVLQPGETVELKAQGTFKEALVCTDRRVLVIKAGFMTGHTFGSDIFQLPYSNVAGAEVNFHLMTGYFELSAGGMQNTRKSYWANRKNPGADPNKAPNCVTLTRDKVEKFREAASYITAKIGASQTGVTAPAPATNDVALLEKLRDLHSQGVLTANEYETKKAEILARL